MTEHEDLRVALTRLVVRNDPKHASKDEVAESEEHRRMMQRPRSEGRSIVLDPYALGPANAGRASGRSNSAIRSVPG